MPGKRPVNAPQIMPKVNVNKISNIILFNGYTYK